VYRQIITVSLRKVVPVECEHCGRPYYYIGKITEQRGSPYTSFSSTRNTVAAAEAAERRAANESAWLRVVRCPYCHRIQRRMKRRVWLVGSIAAAALCLGGATMAATHGTARYSFMTVGAILLGYWIWMAFLQPMGLDEAGLKQEMQQIDGDATGKK
jgi:hypothetical protein